MTLTDAELTSGDTLPAEAARPGVPLWVAALLAVALAGALVAVGLLWQAEHEQRQDVAANAALIEAGAEAREAAERAAVAMSTYDYRTVEEDFAWVDTAATEEFKARFSAISLPSINLVKTFQSKALGEVVDSGVVVEDATHVKVVLFVDQRITGKAEGTSEPDQSRVTMHLVEQGGVWLVDNVELKSYVLTGR